MDAKLVADSRGHTRHANTAYLTMVALDEQGRPTPVPPRAVSTEKQRRLRQAEVRRSNRLAERTQMHATRPTADD